MTEPSPRPPIDRSFWLPVLVGLLLYSGLYALYFPPVFATPDEAEYLRTANGILVGTLWDRDAEDMYFTSRTVGGVHPFRGRSLLFSTMLAGILPHWQAAFLIGLGSHLLVFLLGVLLCRRCGRSPWWAWLLLLHPALSLYSRTIMTDLPGAAIVAGIVVLFMSDKRRPALIGLLAGLSLFFRITNCWIGLAAGLQLLRDDLGRSSEGSLLRRVLRGEAMRFALSYGALCVLLLVGNDVLYGGALKTRYSGTALGLFGFDFLLSHLPVRLAALSMFWPGMLLGVFFLPRRLRWFGVSLVLIQLLFFSSHGGLERGNGLAASLVRSLRYLVGSVVVLSVGYVSLIETVLRRRELPRWLVAGAIAGALAATFMLFRVHDGFLQRQADVVVALYRVTPEGSRVYFGPNARELFVPALGARDPRPAKTSFLSERYADVRAGDYFVFHLQRPPRTPGQELKVQTALRMIADLERIAEIQDRSVDESLRIYSVEALRPGATLAPLDKQEIHRLFLPEHELELFSGE